MTAVLSAIKEWSNTSGHRGKAPAVRQGPQHEKVEGRVSHRRLCRADPLPLFTAHSTMTRDLGIIDGWQGTYRSKTASPLYKMSRATRDAFEKRLQDRVRVRVV